MKTQYRINIQKNKSRTYMLPMIDDVVKLDFYDLLLNTYLSFENGDEVFCILYQWDSNKLFTKYEGKLMSANLFVGHEDYGDKVLYKFKLSENMIIERELFVKGDYKNFSKHHKYLINEFFTKKIKAKNVKDINNIVDINSSLKSTPPLMDKEEFTNHLKKIEFKATNPFEE
tara:strand:+ start:1276 stop:1791 length:516 start_codon:yes stop_codon:yes gene_type:complete